MYKNIDTKFAYRAFTGGPIICIFTKSKEGIANGMTAAWSCPFDTNELLLVLDKGHTTSKNIIDGSKIVIALPNSEQVDELLKLGSVHGRDCKDKLKEQGINTELSEKFQMPVMKNALAYFECKLSDKDLFTSKGICLSKVVNVYVKNDMWNEKNNSFDKGCLHTLHHVSEANFTTGGELVK